MVTVLTREKGVMAKLIVEIDPTNLDAVSLRNYFFKEADIFHLFKFLHLFFKIGNRLLNAHG